MKNNKETSDDKRLNNIVFEEYERTTVRTAIRDQETGEQIPGIRRSKFLLSVPYCVRDKMKVPHYEGKRVSLVNPNGHFGLRDSFYEWGSMTADIARKMTGLYFEYNKSIGAHRLLIGRVKTAVYKKPGVSLDEGYHRNAFEVGGTLYRWDKRDDQETTDRRPTARPNRGFFQSK